MTTKNRKEKTTLQRLLESQQKQRQLILAAAACSIINKLFDLAPPILIGLSVDVVVREESSWIAKIGFESVPNQIGFLAIISPQQLAY